MGQFTVPLYKVVGFHIRVGKIYSIIRASPVTACICIRIIWKQEVASVRDARANAGNAPTHLVSLTIAWWSYLTAVTTHVHAIGLSHLTKSINAARFITVAETLHKSTLCKVCCSSCITSHPGINLTRTIGLLPACASASQMEKRICICMFGAIELALKGSLFHFYLCDNVHCCV